MSNFMSDGSSKEWLQSLKVDDEVAIRTTNWGNSYAFRRITRITATQIVFGTGEYASRFNREDGRERDRYSRRSLVPATPELKAEIVAEARHRELVARLNGERWQHHTVETLERVAAALDAAEEEK